MLYNDDELIDSPNDTDATPSGNEVDDDINDIDDVDTLRDIIAKKNEAMAKAEASSKKLYARLKKEQGYVQDDNGNWVRSNAKTARDKSEPRKSYEVSQSDLLTLIKADITEETDIEQLQDYAKLKGLTISEALKSPVMKSILSELKENRAVALAANTGASRKQKTQLSDDVILDNASQGKLPDDAEMLAKARFQTKFNKK